MKNLYDGTVTTDANGEAEITFGQPEERSIEWAIHPEKMRQQKEQQEKAAREQNNKAAKPAARPNHR